MYWWYLGIILLEGRFYLETDLSARPIFSPSVDSLCEGNYIIEILCLEFKTGDNDFFRNGVSCLNALLKLSVFFMFLNWRLHGNWIFSFPYIFKVEEGEKWRFCGVLFNDLLCSGRRLVFELSFSPKYFLFGWLF